MTPVWAPRPHARPMPASSLGERLSERWHETREALKRAGPNPLRRYVLDLNVAAPGREGPIETLDYGLVGHNSWSFAGNFMFVTLERALAADEGIDLSFLFDRKDEERPAGVDTLFPAALLGLALLPIAAGLYLLGRNLLAWRRRRRRKAPAPRPLPERPEALSPEVFGSLFGERAPLAPAAGEVWRRLRDAKAVVVDRQEPPNLVLRADPSDLRPPEAALVGLLFGDRGSLPLAEARETAARLGGRLDEPSKRRSAVRRWPGWGRPSASTRLARRSALATSRRRRPSPSSSASSRSPSWMPRSGSGWRVSPRPSPSPRRSSSPRERPGTPASEPSRPSSPRRCRFPRGDAPRLLLARSRAAARRLPRALPVGCGHPHRPNRLRRCPAGREAGDGSHAGMGHRAARGAP